MAGLLNIGLTGLNAAQGGLVTTGHNISNAGTDGYHRQVVKQGTNDPYFVGGVGFFGRGTHISAVTRSYDQFLEGQVLTSANRLSQYNAYNAQISQIDNLLADATSGVSPAMQQFFAGVQEVAANPTSIAARQSMISNAQGMVASFTTTNARLTEIRQSLEGDIGATVEQINSYAKSIAEVNQRILVAQVAGPGVPANDLLDQRDQLIAELNELVKVSTVEEKDGSLNVFIGSGQSLVQGSTASRLTTTQDPRDPTRSSIALIAPNNKEIILPDRLMTGGQLAGLLTFRNEALDPVQNQLGLVALGLMTTFNTQHKLGQDLDGALGQNFFTVPSPFVSPTGSAAVAIDPAKIGQLTGSDYQLINDGGNYSLTRVSDGKIFPPTTVAPATFDVDGLQISGITLAAGDTALIQPTRYAARDIAVAITDTRKVAAGNPVSVTAPLSNSGNGRVENIVTLDTTGMVTGTVPDFANISLAYSSGAFTLPAGYTLSPDANFNPATDSVGKNFTLTSPAGFSFSFKVAGTPVDGDQFTFAPTQKGVADNRNAALLGALQTTKIFSDSGNGPTATASGLYAQIVSSVGNKTHEVQVAITSQEALLAQAQDARDSLSAVNLDEEAANLLRYQQAYQASARVMTVAQTLFDEMLSIAR